MQLRTSISGDLESSERLARMAVIGGARRSIGYLERVLAAKHAHGSGLLQILPPPSPTASRRRQLLD